MVFHQKMVTRWNPSDPQPGFGNAHMVLKNTRTLPGSLMAVPQLGVPRRHATISESGRLSPQDAESKARFEKFHYYFSQNMTF